MAKTSEAAAALEAIFVRLAPLDRKQKPLNSAAWAEVINKFHQEALVVRQTFKLGLLGRAITAYKLQQALLARSYPPEAIRPVIFSMILNAFVGKA